MTADLIDASKVRKVFDQGDSPVEAVSNVDFAVRPGEFVSILGPSGCGKSTLLMMVAGLETATSGSISIRRIRRRFAASRCLGRLSRRGVAAVEIGAR